MSTSTKTRSVSIAEGTSNTAGSTTTGSVIDLRTAYGALVTIRIANGATGPTVAAQANVYTSSDNTTFYLLQSFVAPVTNSVSTDWALDIPAAAMYVRIDVTGNTAQAVTCAAILQVLTTI